MPSYAFEITEEYWFQYYGVDREVAQAFRRLVLKFNLTILIQLQPKMSREIVWCHCLLESDWCHLALLIHNVWASTEIHNTWQTSLLKHETFKLWILKRKTFHKHLQFTMATPRRGPCRQEMGLILRWLSSLMENFQRSAELSACSCINCFSNNKKYTLFSNMSLFKKVSNTNALFLFGQLVPK